jgi:hypothetical protein
LVAGSGNVPIYQSFTIGRVHFILADLRSTRNQPGGTMFGNTQLAWFKQECLYAKNNCLMIAWITSVSWAGDRTDNWGGYTSERTSLSNWFRDNGIQNMFIMSGDAHMLAIDNGSNHDFSSGSNNPYDYPVFAAAAMNNSGSTKGGTYSQGGTFPNPSSSSGQYGLVEVTDNGGNNISFTFKGYRTSGNSTTESIVNNFTFTRTLCNAQRAVPHLSLRDLHEEKKVKLSWHIENSDDSKYVITKSNDGDKFLLLKNDIGLRGEIEDTDPSSGWNYYRVEDRDGEVKIEKKIYVSGKLGKIQISPNPANNKIRIDLENLFDFKEGHYVIFNSDNKSVLMNHINLNNSDNHFEVNTEALSSGLYFLQLNINGMNHTEKFIISK